jgi:hypothetical protein
LLNQWFSGVVKTIVNDVTHDVTNLDGPYNPDGGQSLDFPDMGSSVSLDAKSDTNKATFNNVAKKDAPAQALRNMPSSLADSLSLCFLF